MSENIRLLYDILFETKRQMKPGLLPLIDFVKNIRYSFQAFHNVFRNIWIRQKYSKMDQYSYFDTCQLVLKTKGTGDLEVLFDPMYLYL